MQTPALPQRLATYQHWKRQLEQAVKDLESWLEEHRRATPRAREQLRDALESLAADRLTVALVAEESRGKTELINALFFSDLGGPLLLPPAAGVGAGTLCPTEFLWDGQESGAYLRLLPIETRAQETPLVQLKSDPQQWHQYPLDPSASEPLAAALKALFETKQVSMAEAARLGLSDGGVTAPGGPATQLVEISKWRYAIVSLPHPLLKQGLVILYTPGAAALANEPELTISELPAAQAVLFVLAADVGLTGGDLEIWQRHLKGFQTGRARAILVVLNKVDVLWDKSGERADLEAAVATLRRSTAETLGIAEDWVFPVSARHALVGKARRDEGLLRRSALPALERHLASKMIEVKHQCLIEAIDQGVGEVLDRNRNRIASRITRIKSQLEELEQLRDKSQDVIAQLLERTRREQERYLKGVQQFQQSREELLTQTRHCRLLLEGESIGAMVERAHDELLHSWTTAGLTRAMKGLFDELRRAMQTVATESERIRKLVRETYQLFREDFEYDLATPKVFVPMKYRVEIELLYQEVEAFRRSPGMALTGQGMVIRRFHQQMVSRAQVLFEQLRGAYDGWIRDTLQPLAEEIQEHKLMMEKRLENLQRIGRSKDALQQRIDEMQEHYVGFAQELTSLRNIHNALHYDPLTEQEVAQPPAPVSV